jgi:hypothetical protein
VDDEKWHQVIQNPEHPDHNAYRQAIDDDIGRGPLTDFDPDHNFFMHKTFNSGVFASRRSAIKESDLAWLNQAERKFYRDVLGKDTWTWKSSELFFRDQGRLNYLVHKLSIPLYPLAPELIWVSGAESIHVSPEDVMNNKCDFHLTRIIHKKRRTSFNPLIQWVLRQ